MRVGLISDIHCNAGGLREALDRLGPVDEVLCAGDSIFEYRFSNEVVSLLREREARVVLGNHELVFFSAAGVRARSSPLIDKANLDYLAAQPLTIDVRVDGKRLLMTHASPIAPYDQYVYPGTDMVREIATVDADYVILGHTHYQMAERAGKVLVINPGSAGDARDPRNGRVLSCAVLDTVSGEVAFHNFEAARGPAL